MKDKPYLQSYCNILYEVPVHAIPDTISVSIEEDRKSQYLRLGLFNQIH